MFNLKEFNVLKNKLSSFLLWAYMAEDGVLINKDGSFQRTFEYRGPDLDSVTESELVVRSAQVNNALKRLQGGWAFFSEAQRFKSREYPHSDWPDKISRAIDNERAIIFRSGEYYESRYFITFVFIPPQDMETQLKDKLIENKTQARNSSCEEHLLTFIAETNKIQDLLKSVFPFLKALDGDQTLTYLHSTISTKHHPVIMPETPTFLDAYLCDQPLLCGLEPKLGDHCLKVLSVLQFPQISIPGILDKLNRLGFGYRWVTRFIALDKQEAINEIEKYRKRWFAKRKSIGAQIKEAIFKEESALQDSDAMAKAEDAQSALSSINAGFVAFGYYTSVLVISDSDSDAAENKIREAERVINEQGFVTIRETINAVEAWLSSHPGQCYANVRQPLINTLNLVHMLPFSAVWAGDDECKHLSGPPLLQAVTSGNTLFRFSHHVADVGHMMILGPTGAGKSVLMCLCETQFRRYRNSQVYIFDIGGSAQVLTYGMGGDFYEIGSEDSPSFQPLRMVDYESERIWAAEWLTAIIEGEKIKTTVTGKKELDNALRTLSTMPIEQRTLTGITSVIQSKELRQAFELYTMDGIYGPIIDADNESLSISTWSTFEMGKLMDSPKILPIITAFLFHRIDQKLAGQPTAIYIDEAWRQLENPHIQKQIKHWLLTARKNNTSIVFATAGVSTIQNSPLTPILLESCPTRVFLPNPEAGEPKVRSVYDAFGLNDRQIGIIATASAKQDYYCVSHRGNRLFQLALGDIALAFCARASKEDRKLAKHIFQKYGKENFPHRWLEAIGRVDLAEAIG